MSKFIYIFICLPVFCFSITNEEFFQIQRAQRQVHAFTVKADAAGFDIEKSRGVQENNGDESLYDDLRESFNKGLAHNSNGFPNTSAFESLVQALTSRDNSLYDDIQIGLGDYKLVNPQASLTCSLLGNDGWINTIPPAPTFASAESAGEMVEVYWTALVRDVPFNEFDTNATVADAINELNTLSNFKGPKIGGVVTAQTFLRGNTSGDLIGPYISQFFYLPVPYGTTDIPIEQMVPIQSTANDFNTTFNDWLTTVKGGDTGNTITFDPTMTFLRTPRDLGEYVHQDTPEQAALSALLILDSFGTDALDTNNPYFNNRTQVGFVTFGIGEILSLTRVAVQEGLKAAWFQKWQVHRRLRPEEYGFYVQMQKANSVNMGISSELINSQALDEIFSAFGSYFLPVAYPEGSPTHPSYPAGHATFMGAAVTILKAYYNENFEIPNPLQPNATNDALEAYPGTLTIGNELNKLAANIALGRDHAGVHYRSDGIEGILLGEKIALDVLENEASLINEDFPGFSLTKFDGSVVTIGGN